LNLLLGDARELLFISSGLAQSGLCRLVFH
jgi:hypothetical protein